MEVEDAGPVSAAVEDGAATEPHANGGAAGVALMRVMITHAICV